MAVVSEDTISKLSRLGLEPPATERLDSLPAPDLVKLLAGVLNRYDDAWAWDYEKATAQANIKNVSRFMNLMELGHYVTDLSGNHKKKNVQGLNSLLEKFEQRHGAGGYTRRALSKSKGPSLASSMRRAEGKENVSAPRPEPVQADAPTARIIPSGRGLARTPLKAAPRQEQMMLSDLDVIAPAAAPQPEEAAPIVAMPVRRHVVAHTPVRTREPVAAPPAAEEISEAQRQDELAMLRKSTKLARSPVAPRAVVQEVQRTLSTPPTEKALVMNAAPVPSPARIRSPLMELAPEDFLTHDQLDEYLAQQASPPKSMQPPAPIERLARTPTQAAAPALTQPQPAPLPTAASFARTGGLKRTPVQPVAQSLTDQAGTTATFAAPAPAPVEEAVGVVKHERLARTPVQATAVSVITAPAATVSAPAVELAMTAAAGPVKRDRLARTPVQAAATSVIAAPAPVEAAPVAVAPMRRPGERIARTPVNQPAIGVVPAQLIAPSPTTDRLYNNAAPEDLNYLHYLQDLETRRKLQAELAQANKDLRSAQYEAEQLEGQIEKVNTDVAILTANVQEGLSLLTAHGFSGASLHDAASVSRVTQGLRGKHHDLTLAIKEASARAATYDNASDTREEELASSISDWTDRKRALQKRLVVQQEQLENAKSGFNERFVAMEQRKAHDSSVIDHQRLLVEHKRLKALVDRPELSTERVQDPLHDTHLRLLQRVEAQVMAHRALDEAKERRRAMMRSLGM